MKISLGELLVLDLAVSEIAEEYGLPIYCGFRVMNDIKNYNKLGGLKKQLDTLCAQLYTVKDVCSHQYQAMVALVKLQSYGITEEHILHLKDFFERNKTN